MKMTSKSKSSLKPDSQRVYQFVYQYIDERGFSPSQREIAEGCFMARASVQRHLDVLEAKGFIEREMGMARSLSLTDRTPDLDEVEAAEEVRSLSELRHNRDSR
jgi:SOS-response transcriptional repressor LexA